MANPRYFQSRSTSTSVMSLNFNTNSVQNSHS